MFRLHYVLLYRCSWGSTLFGVLSLCQWSAVLQNCGHWHTMVDKHLKRKSAWLNGECCLWTLSTFLNVMNAIKGCTLEFLINLTNEMIVWLCVCVFFCLFLFTCLLHVEFLVPLEHKLVDVAGHLVSSMCVEQLGVLLLQGICLFEQRVCLLVDHARYERELRVHQRQELVSYQFADQQPVYRRAALAHDDWPSSSYFQKCYCWCCCCCCCCCWWWCCCCVWRMGSR